MVWCDPTWSDLVSRALTWSDLVSRALTWSDLVSRGLTWSDLVSPDLSWSDLVWPGLIWSHVVWPGLIWSHLICPGLIWSHVVWPGLIWSRHHYKCNRLHCRQELLTAHSAHRGPGSGFNDLWLLISWSGISSLCSQVTSGFCFLFVNKHPIPHWSELRSWSCPPAALWLAWILPVTQESTFPDRKWSHEQQEVRQLHLDQIIWLFLLLCHGFKCFLSRPEKIKALTHLTLPVHLASDVSLCHNERQQCVGVQLLRRRDRKWNRKSDFRQVLFMSSENFSTVLFFTVYYF